MSRGPELHATKSCGYDGTAQFIVCTCGLRFEERVADDAGSAAHLAAIDQNHADFKWHQGVAARARFEAITDQERRERGLYLWTKGP